MEDFSKPKIIWKRIGSILRFSFDGEGRYGLDSTCFSTGSHIGYLCCVLNSLMGHYMFKDSPKTGTGDLLVSVQAIEPIRIPHCSSEIEGEMCAMLKRLINDYDKEIEKRINNLIFELYGLSTTEMMFVSDFVTQSQQSQ